MLKFSFEEKFLTNLPKLSTDQIHSHFTNVIKQNKEISQILESIELAITTVKPDGTVMHLNHEAEKLFKIHREKAKGKNALEIVHSPPLQQLLKRVLFQRDKVRNVETELSPGPYAIAKVNGFPIAEEGRITGFVFVVEDITEDRNKVRKGMHEKSIVSLTTLMAGVAHEIKNPLGAIDLHVQLIHRLSKKMATLHKRELQELTGILRDEINRLEMILNNFLFSAQPLKARRQPERLNEIIQKAVQLLTPEIERENIHVRLSLSQEVEVLTLDRNHIRQALINILQNAIYAKDTKKEQNEILIETRRKADRVILVIKDNGIGIDKKDLSYIFDPFFTKRPQGTGIGLTIVYKIIKEHGGEIVLSSEKSVGTEFKIEFPLKSNKYIPQR